MTCLWAYWRTIFWYYFQEKSLLDLSVLWVLFLLFCFYSRIWQHYTYLIHCDFSLTEETQIWYMEGGRCQKSLNRKHDIWPCQQALFVHVNVVTHSSQRNCCIWDYSWICGTMVRWFIHIQMPVSCLCMNYVVMVSTHAKIRCCIFSWVILCHVLCNCLVQCSFSTRKVLI